MTANSLDTSSDRDFALESAFVLTLIAEHLSGWAEEWVLWSTQEFSFLALPDALCTGSSIMPQKKNPDVLELIRGRTARVVGSLTTLLVLIKGLPLAYNRDLQEDKEPLFDAFDTVDACLDLAAVVVDGATLRAERIAARLDEGYLDATTLMEYLIKQGVPQRTGHEIVGHLVGLAERQGCRLADLSDADFLAANPQLTPEVKQTLGVANAVGAFQSYGSTAPGEVEAQLARWQEALTILKAARGSFDSRRRSTEWTSDRPDFPDGRGRIESWRVDREANDRMAFGVEVASENCVGREGFERMRMRVVSKSGRGGWMPLYRCERHCRQLDMLASPDTHPRATGPSDGDREALRILGQGQSRIDEIGGAASGTSFGPDKARPGVET